MGKISINARILQDPFLVGISLIRVSCGAQDVSLYIHVWGSSKAMSDSSKIYRSLLVFFCRLFSLSMHPGHLILVSLISRHTRQPWGRTVGFMVLSTSTQARSLDSFCQFCLAFTKLLELSLSNLLMYRKRKQYFFVHSLVFHSCHSSYFGICLLRVWFI